MIRISFLCFCLVGLASTLTSRSAWSGGPDPVSEKNLDDLQAKVDKLNADYALLRKEGPEAYFRSRNIWLDRAQKDIMAKDLVKIMNLKTPPPYVFLDREKRLFIVKDDAGVTRYKVRELLAGVLNDGRSAPKNIRKLSDYSQLREAVTNQKK